MAAYEDIVRAAQKKTPRAIEVLTEIMEDPDVPSKDRITAASKIISVSTAPGAQNVQEEGFAEKTRVEQYHIIRPVYDEIIEELEAEGYEIERLEKARQERLKQYVV